MSSSTRTGLSPRSLYRASWRRSTRISTSNDRRGLVASTSKPIRSANNRGTILNERNHGASCHSRACVSQASLAPVELIWGYTKRNPLANFAPVELADLVMQTQLAILAVGDDEPLLRSFLHHCLLSLRLR
jgi:hypothetical protein